MSIEVSSHSEFNACATFFWRTNRVYRVYVTDRELFFIRIGGQDVDWATALNSLGFPGVWLGRKLNARRTASLERRSEEADRLSPQVLVHQHPHSFRASISDIRSASFEPGAQLWIYGPHAAVWRLTLEEGRSLRFQFEDRSEAATALLVLRRALGTALELKVVWDEAKERFRRPRPEEVAAPVSTG